MPSNAQWKRQGGKSGDRYLIGDAKKIPPTGGLFFGWPMQPAPIQAPSGAISKRNFFMAWASTCLTRSAEIPNSAAKSCKVA